MAAHLNIHPQYFSSFFHKHFHVSFVEYLTTFRLNHSMEELLHTDHSILEIALNNDSPTTRPTPPLSTSSMVSLRLSTASRLTLWMTATIRCFPMSRPRTTELFPISVSF